MKCIVLADTWTHIETLNLSRNQLTGIPVSDLNLSRCTTYKQNESYIISCFKYKLLGAVRNLLVGLGPKIS